VTYAANHRALERLERTSGARDDNSLARIVFAVDRERRQQRAALALAAVAQALTGEEPPATVQAETSPGYEPLPAPRRESAPTIIPGSPNDPDSSAYMRAWVQDAVEVPEVPDGPDMPRGPWAHWGFERPPSYAREVEDVADGGAIDGES
jgi:hypothetical protein